jgi:tripartite-type tricarboxylate transporter receptor subunit TctC
MTTWFGIFAPKATSPRIVELLNARLQTVIDDPKIRKSLIDSGIEPIGGPVRTFAALVRSDYEAWGKVVKASGMKLE